MGTLGKQKTDTEVAIVGGGAAGLYAAYLLQGADLPYILLEADDHVGGRVFSRPEKHSHLGLTLDEGANLVNSTDTILLRLLDRFDINYVRRLKPGTDSMHYLVGGQEYDQRSFDAFLFRDSREAMNTLLLDQQDWMRNDMRHHDPKLINESIATYLRRSKAGPVLTSILKSFFWSEYGRALDDLNLHVLFDYVEIDMMNPSFKLIPNVDEAYTVPGGLDQVARALEQRCHSSIRFGRRVTKIDEKNGVITICASTTAGPEILTTRQIVFAAPLHALKRMEIMVDGLKQETIEQASNTTYAAGTKLHLKFDHGFTKKYKYTGILLTDTGEQIWPSSTGQGDAGLLTVLTGPLPPGRASAVAHAGRVLLTLDLICPGLSELYVGVERSDAPMSYSGALRPGEHPGLDIHKGGLHWITVGEASGNDLQGYLEGALRSADHGVGRYIVERRMNKPKKRMGMMDVLRGLAGMQSTNSYP